VSAARGVAPSVEEFLRRVDRACADLDPGDRERLMADLAAHTSELVFQRIDVASELGDPEAYAADLRQALGLPEKAKNYRHADRRPRSRSIALALGLAVLVGWGSAASAIALSRGPAPHRLLSGTLSVDGSISVAVPDFEALSVDAAQVAADSAHVYLLVRTQQTPITPAGLTFTIGSVVFQSVPAGTNVPEGTVVSLIIAGA
jgi:hypothetical protein